MDAYTCFPKLTVRILLLGLFLSQQVAAATNSAPWIGGTPAVVATVQTYYSFRPSFGDANGDTLTFTIANKPSWASFYKSTGKLFGTPTTAGTYTGIVISVSDGYKKVSLPAFTITVKNANRAPTISGTPPTSVAAGVAFSFKPTASDADGNTLAFTIANKPGWLNFNTTNGTLSGTPSVSNVGTYAGIVIAVSDGKTSVALPAFSVAVTQIATGRATLSWLPPTANTDGTQLTTLLGFQIAYGTSPTALSKTIAINNASVSAYVIENLSPATWYFAVKAVASDGTQSALSGVVSKTIS